jgi:phosphate transport system protein
VVDSPVNFDSGAMEASGMLHMYDEAINILADARNAFEKEDTVLARSIFKRDDVLDEANDNSPNVISDIIKKDLTLLPEALYILSIIRKLERIGDHAKNISEEIIFYVEAKILKHHKSQADLNED